MSRGQIVYIEVFVSLDRAIADVWRFIDHGELGTYRSYKCLTEAQVERLADFVVDHNFTVKPWMTGPVGWKADNVALVRDAEDVRYG